MDSFLAEMQAVPADQRKQKWAEFKTRFLALIKDQKAIAERFSRVDFSLLDDEPKERH
jgi:hypothetical protein